jgi:hypothetical protein
VGHGNEPTCLRSWARCSEVGRDGGSRPSCSKRVGVVSQGWAEQGRPGWAVQEKKKREGRLGRNGEEGLFLGIRAATFGISNQRGFQIQTKI